MTQKLVFSQNQSLFQLRKFKYHVQLCRKSWSLSLKKLTRRHKSFCSKTNIIRALEDIHKSKAILLHRKSKKINKLSNLQVMINQSNKINKASNKKYLNLNLALKQKVKTNKNQMNIVRCKVRNRRVLPNLFLKK